MREKIKFSLYIWEKKMQKPMQYLPKRSSNKDDNQSNFTWKFSFNLQCYSKTAAQSFFLLPPTRSIKKKLKNIQTFIGKARKQEIFLKLWVKVVLSLLADVSISNLIFSALSWVKVFLLFCLNPRLVFCFSSWNNMNCLSKLFMDPPTKDFFHCT